MLSICSSRFDISLIIPRLKTNQLNSTFVYTYHEIIEIHFRKEESIKSAFVVFSKKNDIKYSFTQLLNILSITKIPNY